MTNEAMVREYVDWIRNARGRTGGTAYNYASTLARLNDYAGDTAFENMSLGRLERFIQRPRRGGKTGAPATQAKDVAVVREFYKYHLNRGNISVNPAAMLFAPKVANKNPKPVPDDDLIKLWNVAADGVEKAYVGLGAFVGLRRREMCELTPNQLFIPGQRLQGFKRKGGGDDVTPYGDLCEIVATELPHLPADEFPDVLADYHAKRKRSPFLIEYGEQVPVPLRELAIHELEPGMTDPNMLNRRMARLCERAEVDRYTPHQLRHTFVTNLLRSGVPLHLVQRMANHSDPAITSRYIKAGANELREWMSRINRHAS